MSEVNSQPKQLNIEFMYIDLEICQRCMGTDDSLDEALKDLEPVLEALDVWVAVRKILVKSEEQARQLRFESSPTIRINGRDIQLEVKESLCESCCEIGAGDVDCRVWTYKGKEYTSAPKAQIIEEILKEIFVESKQVSKGPKQPFVVPDNLIRFFANKCGEKVEGTPPAASPCSCGPSSNSGTCCS